MSDDHADAPDSRSLGREHPERIGHYRILDLIGEGAMGSVYEAAQSEPRRRVALKVIRPGHATPEVLQRFRFEAEAIGRLQHPGIAQVYESGVAKLQAYPGSEGYEVDVPYFAMELVRGQRLDDFLRSTAPNPDSIVRLMIELCDAVQHAHQSGIIHRDLKPANILVQEGTTVGSASDRTLGRIKVLDFGVARSIEDRSEESLLTRTGQVIGTVAYMSPEQVLGESNVDSRLDVFALGVILYEALCGQLPIDVRGESLLVAMQRIREVEPAPLDAVRPALGRDLATIVAKAMEKDPARRYASASELALDLERYLRNEPILARPPSTTYLLQKFARRNRVLVTSVVLILASLLIGSGLAVWGLVRAKREARLAGSARAEAERQSAEAERQSDNALAVNQFLVEMLGEANPTQNPDAREVTVSELLKQSATGIDERFEDQPLVEATIRTAIGAALREMDRFASSGPHLERALALREAAYPDGHADVVQSLLDLGLLRRRAGDYDSAWVAYERALAMQESLVGPDDPSLEPILGALSWLCVERGAYDDAEQLSERAIRVAAATTSRTPLEAIATHDRRASILRFQGKAKEATAEYRESVRLARELPANQRGVLATALQNLASHLGDLLEEEATQESLELQSEALEVLRDIYGEEHHLVATAWHGLAVGFQVQGDFEEAERLYEHALELRRDLFGEVHADVAQTLTNYAYMLAISGETERALSMARDATEIIREVHGPEHSDYVIALNNLGAVLRRTNDAEGALAVYQEALDIARLQGEGHPSVSTLIVNSAGLLRTMGRNGEALEILADHVLRLRESVEADDPLLTKAHYYYGRTLFSANDFEAAYEMLEACLESPQLPEVLGPETPLELLTLMVHCQSNLGDRDSAAALLGRAEAALLELESPSERRLSELQSARRLLEAGTE